MPFSCEYDETQQGGKYVNAPGDYTATITAYEQRTSGNGNPLVEFKFTTTSGKEGRFAVFLTAKAAYKLVQLGEACGVEVLKGKQVVFDERKFVNKKLVVRLVEGTNTTKDGTPYLELPKDKCFFPAATAKAPVAPPAKRPPVEEPHDAYEESSGGEDDLPF